jgi:hypothetical protein
VFRSFRAGYGDLADYAAQREMMKKLLIPTILLIFSGHLAAQTQIATANLTVVDSASCANATTTAKSTVTLPLAGTSGSAVIQLFGTFSATIYFQGTADGADWVSVNALPVSGTQTAVTSGAAAGAWRVNASGLQAIRACIEAYTSGTAVTTITSSPAAAQ